MENKQEQEPNEMQEQQQQRQQQEPVSPPPKRPPSRQRQQPLLSALLSEVSSPKNRGKARTWTAYGDDVDSLGGLEHIKTFSMLQRTAVTNPWSSGLTFGDWACYKSGPAARHVKVVLQMKTAKWTVRGVLKNTTNNTLYRTLVHVPGDGVNVPFLEVVSALSLAPVLLSDAQKRVYTDWLSPANFETAYATWKEQLVDTHLRLMVDHVDKPKNPRPKTKMAGFTPAAKLYCVFKGNKLQSQVTAGSKKKTIRGWVPTSVDKWRAITGTDVWPDARTCRDPLSTFGNLQVLSVSASRPIGELLKEQPNLLAETGCATMAPSTYIKRFFNGQEEAM